jgi:2-C-methyl-D-erythritol 2,4-cyclodiphosphate synthase
MLLLDEVNRLVWEKGFVVVNIDAVIVAEQPKLAPFIEAMCRLISRKLGLNPGQMMVKATTSDGLGFVGKGEGMAAYAAVLLEEK